MNRRSSLNIVGVGVLILGMIGAVLVYEIGQARAASAAAAGDGTWQDGSLTPYDSKSFSHDVQMYNGTAGVLVMKWWDFCDSLKRPGGRAMLVAVGSVVAAAGCFAAARRAGVRNNEA